MRYYECMRSLRGLSLIDVVIGTAIVLVVFVGLFGILRASVEVAGLARAKAAATAIAGSQIEYVRSLDYDSVGTEGGIPSGVIPQTATTTQAGTEFTVRTYIAYVDSPQDGSGGADSNGVTTDYKIVKVTVSYSINDQDRDVVLVTTASPPGIETTVGGGTLRVEVVDAAGLPVPGATVRIQNSATSPAIDLSTFSDVTGTVLLGGAPTSTEYQVAVSKSGYSSAQTYTRDGTNQNPTPGYLTVAEAQTTTSTFAIDVLTSFTLRTLTPEAAGSFDDTFADASLVSSLTNTAVSSGSLALLLSGEPATYAASGSALSTTTEPSYLSSWEDAVIDLDVPALTTATIQVVDATGTLLPDAVLPGNSIGFTTAIDLSSVSTSTYPSLALQVNLSTSDPNATPSVRSWSVNYRYGPAPVANVPITLTGAKTVGSTGTGVPLYKTTVATTTDETGVRTLSLEWDSYDLAVTGYTISTSTHEIPFEVLPGTTIDTSVYLLP